MSLQNKRDLILSTSKNRFAQVGFPVKILPGHYDLHLFFLTYIKYFPSICQVSLYINLRRPNGKIN
ncbi:MAG: hypothetical protein JWR09_5502 [Mucilaginibacter sp.]|nr:hypothetical protein [Mucilaginibacter sp.]